VTADDFSAAPSAPPLSILLVEDNPVNQAMARLCLKRLGYRVDLAENGLLALAAFDARDYDVILMDVQMPELDGLETTRRLRARPLLRQPHIIAMTAGALAEEQEACLAAGMDEVITKPFKLADLSAALTLCAERKRLAEVAAVAATTDDGPLDAAALAQVRQMVGGDEAALAQLVTENLATWERLLHALRPALAAHDGEALRRILHSLAGCTGFFGEKRLAERIAELSCAVRAERRSEIPAIFAALLEEHERARAALLELVAT
jgi:CheY-like chemotaxis protein